MTEYRRLADGTIETPRVEHRRASALSVRTSDDTVTVEGYATTYDEPYQVYGGPPFGFTETISRGAANKTVKEADVRFLFNHDGLPLARSKSGTLDLESDKTGVLIRASLSANSHAASDLLDAMSRGDLDEMSIAFRATRQEWNEDYTERTIREIELLDVSAVTYPANPATHIQVVEDDAPARSAMSLRMARALLDSAAI